MIHIVTAENEFQYRNEMEQAYRLRHQVFVKEMGWSELAKPDRREIDQFDNKHAVHLLYIENGQVLGYQRMLPSTRPHLLSEIMPQLCEVERPVGSHIWECTRHCVAPGHRERGRFAAPIANALLLQHGRMGVGKRDLDRDHRDRPHSAVASCPAAFPDVAMSCPKGLERKTSLRSRLPSIGGR